MDIIREPGQLVHARVLFRIVAVDIPVDMISDELQMIPNDCNTIENIADARHKFTSVWCLFSQLDSTEPANAHIDEIFTILDSKQEALANLRRQGCSLSIWLMTRHDGLNVNFGLSAAQIKKLADLETSFSFRSFSDDMLEEVATHVKTHNT